MMSAVHTHSSILLSQSHLNKRRVGEDVRANGAAQLRWKCSFSSDETSLCRLQPFSRDESRSQRKVQRPANPVARIKRKSEPHLDRVIERDKKVRIVQRIKEILCKHEGRTMSLQQLGRFRKQIGLRGQRKCVVLLNKFPAVFEVFNQGGGQCWFRLTRQAETQYLNEQAMKGELESILVDKVRKLLMMSVQKQVLIEHISHIRRDLGLPEDFRTSMLPNYPHFFRIKQMLDGPTLALTSWDPRLAVSAAEYKEAKEIAELDAIRKTRASATSAYPPPYPPSSTSAASNSESASADVDVPPGGGWEPASGGAALGSRAVGGWEEEDDWDGGVKVVVRGEEFGSSFLGSRPGGGRKHHIDVHGDGLDSDGEGEAEWEEEEEEEDGEEEWNEEEEEEDGDLYSDRISLGGVGEGESLEVRESGGHEGGGEGGLEVGEEVALAALMRGRELVGAGKFGGPNDPMRYRKERRISMKLPAGLNVSRRDLMKMQEFLDLPLVSPYGDATGIKPGSPEAEKRNCGIVHEMLSLTTEKRMLLDHFTHFRKEYKFPARLRGMVIRHPEIFYLSEKGLRDSLFLREAYEGSELIIKDPFKEAFDDLRRLVGKGKKMERLDPDLQLRDDGAEDNKDEDDDEEDEDWDGMVSALENGGQSETVRKKEVKGGSRGVGDEDRPWLITTQPRERVSTGPKEKW